MYKYKFKYKMGIKIIYAGSLFDAMSKFYRLYHKDCGNQGVSVVSLNN